MQHRFVVAPLLWKLLADPDVHRPAGEWKLFRVRMCGGLPDSWAGYVQNGLSAVGD